MTDKDQTNEGSGRPLTEIPEPRDRRDDDLGLQSRIEAYETRIADMEKHIEDLTAQARDRFRAADDAVARVDGFEDRLQTLERAWLSVRDRASNIAGNEPKTPEAVRVHAEAKAASRNAAAERSHASA